MEFVHEEIEFTHVNRMILFTHQKKTCLPKAKKSVAFCKTRLSEA